MMTRKEGLVFDAVSGVLPVIGTAHDSAIASASAFAQAQDVVTKNAAIEAAKGDVTAPTTKALAALLQQQASVINAQSATIQQQAQALTALQNTLAATVADALSHYTGAVVQPMFTALIGGALPGSLDTLTELVAQLQADESGAAAMLASLNGLATRLATAENALLGKAATATVATLQTAVTQHTADIANRLLKAGDTSTGQQNGPDGITDASFVTQRQIAQGVKRPVPFAASVTATNTALVPTLTDPLQKNRSALVVKAYLYMTTAPATGLGATVKIGTTPGASNVLSKTFLVAALPGLNNLLELPQAVLTTVPAGTTLYATASGGTWMVLVDTLFLS